MFWQNFERACTQKGIKPAKVAEACGIGKSNVSLWKNKGYVPRMEAIKALADNLEVTTDYLLGNEKSAPAGDGGDAEDIDFNNLRNADGTPVSEEKMQIIMRILSMGQEDTGNLKKWIDFMDDLNKK